MRYKLIFFALLLASCASQPVQKVGGYSLYPYQTVTPSPASLPDVIVIIETPQPTSTPFVYVIQSGDTLSELAERFKIPQEELRAANPDVSPNSMPVGGTLVIPDLSSSPSAAWTPTPEPMPITQITCHASADSGAWCFALIQNTTSGIVENVSARINLLDEENNAVTSQTAFAPLNIIPPDAALPVYIFFPNADGNLNPQAQLLSAIQLDASDARYLPAKINNAVTRISWDGLTAQIGGQVELQTPAVQIWIAAVAYGKDGRVVGLKRWEGTTPQFDFSVSSLGPAIAAVDLIVEAR